MSRTRPPRAGHGDEVLQDPEVEPLELEAVDEDDHGLEINRRTVLTLGAFLLLSLAALYFLLPQLAGLEDTWHRVEDGSPYWMLVALLFGVAMFFGYVAMFRGIFLHAGTGRIDWRASYQITMAGLAASRIFAAGGAGGLVLTAWALRRPGMAKRVVADKTLTFLILTYIPYMAALIICGLGLRLGIFNGPAPFGLTVVPAVIAIILTAIGVSTVLVPTDLQRRLEGFASGHGRFGKWAQRLANLPASARRGCVTRSSTCATPIRRWAARCSSGPSRSRSCGRRSAPSATPRRSRSSRRRSSLACSATCCRCRAGSAASRVG